MSAIPTEIRRVLDQIRRDVRRHGLWQPGARVLLGCSGGRDSMAALALLAALRPSLGHTLVVAHVDHGLQPNHQETADLVRAQAMRRQLPCAVQAVVLPLGADLEGRAREARYAVLQTMRDAFAADVVVTAHHADDQAETVLLRLARGAGSEALAGVRRTRPDGIVRPFLQVTRAQLALCAAHYAIPWLADPSNDDLKLTRNHVRHTALPALEAAIPGAAAGLARSAELAANQEGALLAWMESALKGRIVADRAARRVVVPVDAVPALAPARAALLRWVCQHLAIAAPSVRAVDQWLVLGTRGEARMRGLTVVGDGHVWQFFANNVARPEPAD